MGFIQATPGEMKSFRSSADKIALIVGTTQVVQYTGTDYKKRFGSYIDLLFNDHWKDFQTDDKYLRLCCLVGVAMSFPI